MDVWRRLVLLEEIVWKLSQGEKLNNFEKKLFNEVIASHSK